MAKLRRPVALVILDGWGLGDKTDEYNAIARAATPVMDELTARCPWTRLNCSGEAVGLPEGQMGNSEVGHLNIGSGRVVYQELTRITKAIKDGSFFTNPVFVKLLEELRSDKRALHLMGLLSDGGVHSHNTHLYALLELAKRAGLEEVYVHAFLDGRDVPPASAGGYLAELNAKIASIGVGRLATISGRYYAMDRDKRWERVAKAYAAVTEADGLAAETADAALRASYDSKVTDEFVVPVVIGDYSGMKSGDGVIFFNFRPDRARELTHAYTDAAFGGFARREGLALRYVTMTQYEAGLNAQVAYKPQSLRNTLGEVLDAAGLRQLRIAETEKYAHVTFFFNGGVEKPLLGEERLLIPSPKVATYDMQPAMSAPAVTDEVVAAIEDDRYDVIILNYANGDMVGHTGVMAAAVQAVETVDACVGRVVAAMRRRGGIVCITADHGNAEVMRDGVTGEPFTAHTTNQVPFIVAAEGVGRLRDSGALCDIAPTVLDLAGLRTPAEMTGTSLLAGK